MLQAVAQEQPDQVLHLGDHASDAARLRAAQSDLAVQGVCGNCDRQQEAPQTLRPTLAGKTIFMTHGHLYHVKTTPYRAVLAAEEAAADLLLYGHTHRATLFQHGNLWVMNPGTCCGTHPATYGIVEIENGGISCQIKSLDASWEE